VLGPSGSGKSTLINLLVPGAKVATNEISQALNSGKHTTTTTTWYWVDEARTRADRLARFSGVRPVPHRPHRPAALHARHRRQAQECKFYNCTHLHEPGCAVMAEVDSEGSPHHIDANRYRIYSELFEELSQSPWR
jgi:ribosome biogenesis GTPase